MEALWNLEDKWNLTTQQALVLFAFTAFALIGLCTATMLKRKAQTKQNPSAAAACSDNDTVKSSNWVRIRRLLMGSVRWSEANKWEEISRRRPPPLLGFEERKSFSCSSSAGWQSHNSVTPVWQRPILMGEKCELPRFSGLILYDQSGRPLDHSLTASLGQEIIQQEKPAAVLRATLKDLL